MKPRFQILFAKESPVSSGGAAPAKPSAPPSGGAEAPAFRPVDDTGPDYFQVVRLKFGEKTVEGLRDPHGWFTPNYGEKIPGEPEGWAPL